VVGRHHFERDLAIVLDRLEAHYAIPGFANRFAADFKAFLQAVDTDDETPELQPYVDSSGDCILSLQDTQWFGPAVSWPKELVNYLSLFNIHDPAYAARSSSDE
jgi:hypothetical protein